jgi:hypothetical protein
MIGEEEPLSVRLSWRLQQPLPSESLWSVMHKLCWLNAIRAPALIRYFSVPGVRKAVFSEEIEGGPTKAQVDLRFRGALDLARVSACLGITEDWSAQATLDRIGKRARVRRDSVTFLRFCPKCIEFGYHSAVSQLVSETRCPVHEEPLVDFCPKCGNRIPYSLPEAKVLPYSCRCGFSFWWGLRDEEWAAPLGKRAADELVGYVEDRLAPESKSNSAGSHLLWLTAPELPSAKSLVRHCRRTARMLPSAVIRHEWGSEFKSQPRSANRQRGSIYSFAAAGRSSLGAEVYSLFRRIERCIYRKFPCSRRKRWLQMTNSVEEFKDVGRARWSREFLAYLLWKTYWLDSTWGSFPRGRKMEALTPFKPQRSRVYWRFMCHARLLRPMNAFTSADEWSQLHYFSLVAFATWRGVLRLVNRVDSRRYPFRTRLCLQLVNLGLPLVVLVRTDSRANAFELRFLTSSPVRRSPVVDVPNDCVVRQPG